MPGASSAQPAAHSTHPPSRPGLGLCQWFHFEDYAAVDRTIALLDELKTPLLRTGLSWADHHRAGGPAWYRWQMKRLHEAGLDVLLSIWHTPPSLSENGQCNGPPRRLQDYADFIDQVISEYGDTFTDLELWNEPNNRYKWDFPHCDPQWTKFGEMIAMAAHWAQHRGKRTILGGMIPVDPHWLRIMRRHRVLDHLDAVAIHGFPGMWWEDAPNWDWYHHWKGWPAKVDALRPVADDLPIWITETGLATWDVTQGRMGRHQQQVAALENAVAAPAERVYWYCGIDLDPAREAIEGFHVDEHEYHLGLVRFDGSKKPAFDRMQDLLRPKALARTHAERELTPSSPRRQPAPSRRT